MWPSAISTEPPPRTYSRNWFSKAAGSAPTSESTTKAYLAGERLAVWSGVAGSISKADWPEASSAALKYSRSRLLSASCTNRAWRGSARSTEK